MLVLLINPTERGCSYSYNKMTIIAIYFYRGLYMAKCCISGPVATSTGHYEVKRKSIVVLEIGVGSATHIRTAK